MVSRNIYISIIVRVCLIASTAILMAWLTFDKQIYLFAAFLLLIFIIEVIELVNFLNRTNQKIAFFFDAIRNDDSTLKFPERTGNKAMNELNASLNNVNELIKKIKFELEEQEQYFKTILEHVSIGIITYNENGNIYLSNSAARNLLNHEHLTHINQIQKVDKKLFQTLLLPCLV